MNEVSVGAIKLSVCVITYNQAKYIGQCLKSIIDQDVDFAYEIIVGDDFSTDGTREIVIDFSKKYPNIVKPILHEPNNSGGVTNYISVHNAAKGEYVAHVDGDDYCLPGKMQSQVNFLDQNPDCLIVWHRMDIQKIETGEIFTKEYDVEKISGKKFGIDDVISNITMGLHSSKMYRNVPFVRPLHIDALDFSENLLLLHAGNGFASFVGDQSYGVYRLNGGLSKNTAKIRNLIYNWLYYFYQNKIGSPSILFAKLLLMVLSDFKWRVSSFLVGLYFLIRMPRGLLPFKMFYCKEKLIPASLNCAKNIQEV